ncbi:hypothetical protein COSO111634_05235 [Corallococcus soli]
MPTMAISLAFTTGGADRGARAMAADGGVSVRSDGGRATGKETASVGAAASTGVVSEPDAAPPWRFAWSCSAPGRWCWSRYSVSRCTEFCVNISVAGSLPKDASSARVISTVARESMP